MSWFTFSSGKEVQRPEGRRGREPHWLQLGVYSEQRVMRWQGNFFPSGLPLHLLIIFFPLWKRMRLSEKQEGAFLFPLAPPVLSALSKGLPTSWWELSLGTQSKGGPSQTQQPHHFWGTHHLSLKPWGGMVWYTLKQITHPDFYQASGMADMKPILC